MRSKAVIRVDRMVGRVRWIDLDTATQTQSRHDDDGQLVLEYGVKANCGR